MTLSSKEIERNKRYRKTKQYSKMTIPQVLSDCIFNGIYSTQIIESKPNKSGNYKWIGPQEATFGDYSSMKEGDNIYFFFDRMIYGIGELNNIKFDCKFNNYPSSSLPNNQEYESIKTDLLFDFGINSNKNRWICTFKPSPYFFKKGVDMDEVLLSNPSKFRMLRIFSALSFLKIDDEENKALKDIIIKTNEQVLSIPTNNVFEFDDTDHLKLYRKIKEIYKLNIYDFLESCINGTSIIHEMALEAGLLYQISQKHHDTIKVFGEWDYIHHQVIASPFKPLEYIDKMDIFGYKYIPGFDVLSKYLLVELKKDSASEEDIEQVLKYVDWVKQEYAFGDYSMINAFLVAHVIPPKVV